MKNTSISVIILAGGKSSRMGYDKCDLLFNGVTLLNNQIDKVKQLGINDIVVSGYKGNNCTERIVFDNIKDKGPLSGLEATLREIKNDLALVLSIDVPLIPKYCLSNLIDFYFEKAFDYDSVILKHNDKIEPLIGIYKKKCADNIKTVLNNNDYKVRTFLNTVKYTFYECDLNDEYFLNINNRDDYDKLLKLNLYL